MKWGLAWFAANRGLWGSAFPAPAATDLPKPVSGPAPNTAPPLSSATWLLQHREWLIAQRDKLHRNDPRRAKLDRRIYLVNHERMRVEGDG